MYKIKIFDANTPGDLQYHINEWFLENRNIMVHGSNLATPVEVAGAPSFYFYVLYSSNEQRSEELKQIAAAVTQEQSIDVKEINPEIMKASS